MGLLRVAFLISEDFSPFPDNTSFNLFVKELEKLEVQLTPCYLDKPHSRSGRENRTHKAENSALYSVARLFEHADEYDIIHSLGISVPLAFSKLVTAPLAVTLDWNACKKDMQLYRKYNNTAYYISDAVAGQSEELIYFDTVYTCAALDNSRFFCAPGTYCLIFCSHRAELEHALELSRRAGLDLTAVIPASSGLDSDPEIAQWKTGAKLTLVKDDGTADMTAILGNAAAVLHFSTGKKSFDTSIIKAQSLGVPVVAFPDAMMEELVINGVNGFLVDSNDKAAAVLGALQTFNREECRRSYLKRFSPAAMAAGYRRVYERIYEIEKQDSKRPWGFFSILYFRPPGCKVKEFVVLPGKRLSLQKHTYRGEYWQIVEGKGLVTLDSQAVELSAGSNITIPKNSVHRVENVGTENLVIIEVQQGDYVGEDDIIRLQDDFGRSQDN